MSFDKSNNPIAQDISNAFSHRHIAWKNVLGISHTWISATKKTAKFNCLELAWRTFVTI